jgi:filamentous hemagglutinin family protein
LGGVRLATAAAACVSFAVHANPTGPTIVNGSATFKQAGNLLQITNSPKAIINWQSFSIGAGEITRFVQQNSASAVLNRVTTQNPSSILGTLQSNGRVLLINSNGIVFGKGSVVDTAGFVASSLNLSNADFLAGRMNFTAVPGAGSVINQGNISTGNGGSVYLVGPAVTNSGIITSPKGEVVLAAGNSVELVNPGTPNLRVEITAPDNRAVNLGEISAESGRVGIFAGLINHSGSIRADSAQIGENGRIILKATEQLKLEAGSAISARGHNGADGGFIETSAKSVEIDPAAVVTAAAPGGRPGTWLIDPVDITIVHGGGVTLGGGTSQIFSPAVGTTINDGTINATLDGGTSVVIQTSGGAGGNGDIVLFGTADAGGAVTILNSSGGIQSITLNADRNIEMRAGASISASPGNSLGVTFNAITTTVAGTVGTGTGTVLVTGPVTLPPGATLTPTSLTVVGNTPVIVNTPVPTSSGPNVTSIIAALNGAGILQALNQPAWGLSLLSQQLLNPLADYPAPSVTSPSIAPPKCGTATAESSVTCTP